MSETDQSVEQSDPVKPWTVKGVPPEARNAAIAAAKRNKLPIGDWLVRSIRAQVQAEHQGQRAPAVMADQSAERSDPAADLAAVERLVAMVSQLATATGEAPPEAVSRTAYRLLRRRLAVAAASQTK